MMPHAEPEKATDHMRYRGRPEKGCPLLYFRLLFCSGTAGRRADEASGLRVTGIGQELSLSLPVSRQEAHSRPRDKYRDTLLYFRAEEEYPFPVEKRFTSVLTIKIRLKALNNRLL